jgi:hypothetical protein
MGNVLPLKQPVFRLLFAAALALFGFFGMNSSKAQTIIYTQNFGTTSPNVIPTGWVRTGTGTATNLQFNSTTPSSTYTVPVTASGGVNMVDNAGAVGATQIVTTSAIDVTGFGTVQLLWGARRSSSAYGATPAVQWSSDGTNWNNISYTDIPAAGGSWLAVNSGNWITLGSGADNISTLQLRFTFTRTGTGGNYRIDDITVRGSSLSTPTILTSGTIGSFYTTQGTASSAQSFTVSGSGLGSTPILISAPAGFEVKTGANAYSSSVSLTPDGSGSVANTVIDVRVAASILAGEYSATLTCTSGAATPVNFAAQALVRGPNVAYTPGNIVVAQPSYFTAPVGSSAAMVLLREYTPAGTYVQTFEVPVADNGSNQTCTVLYGSTTETNLQLSDNGQYLTWTGYDAAPGTASLSGTSAASVNRIVGFTTIDGAINTSTRISDAYDANVIRGAVTDNGARFWVSGVSTGAGGVRLVNLGSTGSSTLLTSGLNNSRAINIENNQLFVSSAASGFVGINRVGTGLPTTATTTTIAIPFTDPRAFALLDLDNGVAGDDVAYIAGNSGIFKFYNNGTAWVAMGSLTGTAISHLTAAVNGANVDIYVTDGANMYKIIDAAGPSSNISNNGSTLASVATWTRTAFANTAFRGVAFAPTSAPVCTFYQDNDGDGFGNFSVSQTALCSAPPAGYVTVSGDCNDALASVFPGAIENACNSIDDDCDTTIDEGFVAGCSDPLACNFTPGATCTATCDYNPITWYIDGDGDGFGSSATSQVNCAQPVGYVANNTDCNDAVAAINPGVIESAAASNICDDIDNDCDLTIDETSVPGCNDPLALNYNAAATCAEGCVLPTGFVPGNIVVSRVGTGASALTSNATPIFITEIDEVTGTQSYLLPMPTTGVNRLLAHGTATSEGYLTRNSNGSVVIAGYDAPTTQSSVNGTTSSSVNRVVNEIDPDFSVARAAGTTSSFSATGVRSAAANGTDYWMVGGNTGVLYAGSGPSAIVSSTVPNTRVVQTHNGNLYFSTSSGSRGIYQVGTGLPTTSGTTSVRLIDVTSTGEPTDFQFNDDMTVCFVADERTNGSGGIQKWTFDGTNWSLAYTVSLGTTTGARGCYVDFYSAANPIVYALTRRTSGVNAVVRFTDTNISNPTLTTLSTSPTNTVYTGIEASPCTPITWYRDADGDGFGNTAITRSSCTQPLGYVSVGGDCDDTWDLSYPSALEDCDNRDNDCDLVIDDNCLNIPDNNTINHALVVNPTTFPSCLSNVLNLDLTNATSSVESTIVAPPTAGQDAWYRFVATTTAVRIFVSSTANNIALELLDSQENSLAVEDALNGLGGEILTYGALTIGQTYFVAVKNVDAGSVGASTVCIQRLNDSRCSNGGGNNFSGLCVNFKVAFTGANQYVLQFTEVPTVADPLVDVFTYTTPGAGTTIPLSAIVGLNYGRQYEVRVSAIYNLADAGNNIETITVPTDEFCVITIAAQPELNLRASDASPNIRFTGSILAADRWLCGASFYRWEFTQLTPVAGLAQTVNGPAGNRFLPLVSANAQIPGLIQPGATYNVRVAPVFGTIEGSFGTVDQTLIIAGAGMPVVEEEMNNYTERSFEVDGIQAAVYPNPNTGDIVNLAVSGLENEQVFVRVLDAQGRVVAQSAYAVDGVLNTIITFDRTLNNGLYMIEIMDGSTLRTERMVVQK